MLSVLTKGLPSASKKPSMHPLLKVVGNEKGRGVAEVAYDRYWFRNVVIDVRFYFYLAAILDLILFPFPLTPAQ